MTLNVQKNASGCLKHEVIVKWKKEGKSVTQNEWKLKMCRLKQKMTLTQNPMVTTWLKVFLREGGHGHTGEVAPGLPLLPQNLLKGSQALQPAFIHLTYLCGLLRCISFCFAHWSHRICGGRLWHLIFSLLLWCCMFISQERNWEGFCRCELRKLGYNG